MTKQDFPIFQAHPELVYLDNAATTQKPQVVIDAIVDFYSTSNANIGRSVCELGDLATTKHEQARQTARQFVNARYPEEIVFTRSTTESLNLLATILADNLTKGDEIILTELEHHSNLIPWQQLAKKKGLKLKFIPLLPTGQLNLQKYTQLLNSKTRVVAVSQLSNVLGVLNDVKQIVDLAKQQGALTIVDAAQSISKIKTDVQELGCDFLVFSGHKIYGPTGIGVLYGRKELLERLPPYQTGGKTINQVSLETSTLAPLPAKYEAGTPNIAGAVGLKTALEFVIQHSKIQNSQNLLFPEEADLTKYAEEQFVQIPEVKILAKDSPKLGTISFTLEGVHSLDAATYLAGKQICLRSGHHCAKPLLQKLGIETTLRISLAIYNDHQDIDYFVKSLQRAIHVLK